jgi:hypothetical protein
MKIVNCIKPLVFLYLVIGGLSPKAHAQTWVLTSAPTNEWSTVASSADGTRLIAASGYGFYSTTVSPIYLSTNAGLTWSSNNSPVSNWGAVASSADGSRLFAGTAGQLFYISTNGGASWSSSNSFSAGFGVRSWTSIACSTDGMTLVAASEGVGILTYASSNSAATCTIQLNLPDGDVGSDVIPGGVALSADGTQMIATFADVWGGIFNDLELGISSDSGVIWSWTYTSPFLTTLVSSANVSNLVAAAGYSTLPIYTSTNGGLSFSATGSPADDWFAVASSADGTRLAAAALSGAIYTSTNAGASWLSNNVPALNWRSLASSADGTRLVAASAQGIYISQPPPALSIALTSDSLALSWPSTTLPFFLQQNCDLATSNWKAVSNSPSLTNGWYQMSVSAASGATFYRLWSP